MIEFLLLTVMLCCFSSFNISVFMEMSKTMDMIYSAVARLEPATVYSFYLLILIICFIIKYDCLIRITTKISNYLFRDIRKDLSFKYTRLTRGFVLAMKIVFLFQILDSSRLCIVLVLFGPVWKSDQAHRRELNESIYDIQVPFTKDDASTDLFDFDDCEDESQTTVLNDAMRDIDISLAYAFLLDEDHGDIPLAGPESATDDLDIGYSLLFENDLPDGDAEAKIDRQKITDPVFIDDIPVTFVERKQFVPSTNPITNVKMIETLLDTSIESPVLKTTLVRTPSNLRYQILTPKERLEQLNEFLNTTWDKHATFRKHMVKTPSTLCNELYPVVAIKPKPKRKRS